MDFDRSHNPSFNDKFFQELDRKPAKTVSDLKSSQPITASPQPGFIQESSIPVKSISGNSFKQNTNLSADDSKASILAKNCNSVFALRVLKDEAAVQNENKLSPEALESYKIMILDHVVDRIVFLVILTFLSAAVGLFAFRLETIGFITMLWIAIIGIFILNFIIRFTPGLSPVLSPLYSMFVGYMIGVMLVNFELANIKIDYSVHIVGRGFCSGLAMNFIGILIGETITYLVLFKFDIMKLGSDTKSALALIAGGSILGLVFTWFCSMIGLASFNFTSSLLGIVLSLFAAIWGATLALGCLQTIERAIKPEFPSYLEWYSAYRFVTCFVFLYACPFVGIIMKVKAL